MQSLLSITLALTLAPAGDHVDAHPQLSPAASIDNEKAMDAYERGDYQTALDRLFAVYAAYPDPLAHRETRDFVFSSIRSTWRELYTGTGSREQACAWRAFLAKHYAAQGHNITAHSAAWWKNLTAEVDAWLMRDFPATPNCDGVSAPHRPPTPAEVTVPSAEVTIPPAPAPDTPPAPAQPATPTRPPPRVLAGQVLISTGVLLLVAAAVGGGVYADRYRRIGSLDAFVDGTGAPSTDRQEQQVRAWEREGRLAGGLGIAAGVAGGASLVVGVAALVTGRASARRWSVTPRTAGGWGLSLAARF